MLAFTDEALCHLAVAATGIAPAERGDWLQALASRLERSERDSAPAPSPGARYTREWRARLRAGRVRLVIETDEVELVVGLVDHNLLDPLHADDLTAITKAAKAALMRFVRGEASPLEPELRDMLRARTLSRLLKPLTFNCKSDSYANEWMAGGIDARIGYADG